MWYIHCIGYLCIELQPCFTWEHIPRCAQAKCIISTLTSSLCCKRIFLFYGLRPCNANLLNTCHLVAYDCTSQDVLKQDLLCMAKRRFLQMLHLPQECQSVHLLLLCNQQFILQFSLHCRSVKPRSFALLDFLHTLQTPVIHLKSCCTLLTNLPRQASYKLCRWKRTSSPRLLRLRICSNIVSIVSHSCEE